MDPNEITEVEDDLFPMLVCLGLIGCIGLLNLTPNLLVELLDFLNSLGCFHVRLGIHRPWSENKRKKWLNPINHLERGHSRGLARGLVVCKLGMCEWLIL